MPVQTTQTITGLTAGNKVYDGLTTVSVSGTAAYVGLANGQTFTVTGTPSFSFATASFQTLCFVALLEIA